MIFGNLERAAKIKSGLLYTGAFLLFTLLIFIIVRYLSPIVTGSHHYLPVLLFFVFYVTSISTWIFIFISYASFDAHLLGGDIEKFLFSLSLLCVFIQIAILGFLIGYRRPFQTKPKPSYLKKMFLDYGVYLLASLASGIPLIFIAFWIIE